MHMGGFPTLRILVFIYSSQGFHGFLPKSLAKKRITCTIKLLRLGCPPHSEWSIFLTSFKVQNADAARRQDGPCEGCLKKLTTSEKPSQGFKEYGLESPGTFPSPSHKLNVVFCAIFDFIHELICHANELFRGIRCRQASHGTHAEGDR